MPTREEERPSERAPEAQLETILGWALRVGVLLVVTGMLVAFVWSWSSGAFPSVRGVARLPQAFDASALVLATALLLVLLPPARVILAAVTFARERDWLYLAFSMVALALIVASTLLGVLLRKG